MAHGVNIGVLASGRGSNLQAIIDAIEQGKLKAVIKVVISDVADAFALERARKHGIRAEFIDPRPFSAREDYDRVMIPCLREHDVELVVMAGFMRVLSKLFIESFKNRIMNIHPALLPSFPGLNVQKQAVEHGVKFSGCTVHFADTGVDTGPIIIQAVVPVLDSDTGDTLAERILRQEHKLYPKAIQLYAEGRLKVRGRRVLVEGIEEDFDRISFVNPPLEK